MWQELTAAGTVPFCDFPRDPFVFRDSEGVPPDDAMAGELLQLSINLYDENCASESAKAAQTLGIQNVPPDVNGFRPQLFMFMSILMLIFRYQLGQVHYATVATMLKLMHVDQEVLDAVFAVGNTGRTTEGSTAIPDLEPEIYDRIWIQCILIWVISRGWKARGMNQTIQGPASTLPADITGRGFNCDDPRPPRFHPAIPNRGLLGPGRGHGLHAVGHPVPAARRGVHQPHGGHCLLTMPGTELGADAGYYAGDHPRRLCIPATLQPSRLT